MNSILRDILEIARATGADIATIRPTIMTGRNNAAQVDATLGAIIIPPGRSLIVTRIEFESYPFQESVAPFSTPLQDLRQSNFYGYYAQLYWNDQVGGEIDAKGAGGEIFQVFEGSQTITLKLHISSTTGNPTQFSIAARVTGYFVPAGVGAIAAQWEVKFKSDQN